jgi:SOUL heme-binding protein
VIIAAISIPLTLFSLWMASGYFPTRNIAMPAYSVIDSRKEYEIRRYEAFIIAETRLSGNGGSSGFRELFQYISGDNVTQSKIAMSAPVIKSADIDGEGTGQKLPMTAPVLKSTDAGAEMIAFVMPPGSVLSELPRPQSQAITLRALPSQTVAVITFSGFAGSAVSIVKTALLLEALQRDGITITSEPRTALYNPPWTPPFMRRNEIQVEIETVNRQ